MDDNKIEQEPSQEAEFDKNFPVKDYKKNTFSFSTPELRELQSWDATHKTAMLMQADAQKLISTVVSKALSRLNIKNSPAIQVLYDVNNGTLLTWEPRIWCSVCKNAKAEFQFQEKVFCAVCIVPVREGQAKQAVEQAKEKIEAEVKPAEAKPVKKEVKKK